MKSTLTYDEKEKQIIIEYEMMTMFKNGNNNKKIEIPSHPFQLNVLHCKIGCIMLSIDFMLLFCQSISGVRILTELSY